MAYIAKALSKASKNKGESGYKIGVTVVDEQGDPVTVTGDVKLLYIDSDGVLKTLIGESSGNVAFYTVPVSKFAESFVYKYWIQCFALDKYGPYELKIYDIA